MARRIALILLVAVLGGGGALYGASLGGPENYFYQGLAALADDDLAQAQSAFERSRQLDPRGVESLLGLAEVAQRRNQDNEVEKLLQQALARAPDNAQVHIALGRYFYNRRQYDRSETHLKKAAGLEPKAVAAFVDLGDLYMLGLHQPSKAVQAYRDFLALEPDHAGAHYALGIALATLGDLYQARQMLEQAARLAPANPLPLYALGKLHIARRDPPVNALERFAAALRVSPEFFQAHLARGDIFMAYGAADDAVAEYQAALKIAPDQALAWVKIGMIEQLRQRLEQAEQAYHKALALDPQQAIAYNNLAFLAAERRERLDEALRWSQKALDLAPELPPFLDTLGWVHRARGELQKAIAVLEKAVSLDYRPVEVLYHLGGIYVEMGKTDPSVISALEPRQAEIYYHLGVVYEETDQFAKAGQTLYRALALQEDFTGADDARRRLVQIDPALWKALRGAPAARTGSVQSGGTD